MNSNDHRYHNNGDLTFTDVTNLLGGPTAPQVNGHCLVPAFVDYGDGWIDLYVGNDVGGGGCDVQNNTLLQKRSDGTYVQVQGRGLMWRPDGS